MTSTDERPMRDWVVERTWLVRAQSATKALEATARRDPDHVRTYEGPPRPWEAP